MKNLGYYNGKFGELEEMSIPMNDRVSWFGDGVYDAGPSRNYHIFALDEHIDRFFGNAAKLEVTRGTGIRDHVFTEGPGNLWVMLKPAKISDGAEPVHLVTTEDTRFFHCDIKTLNLIPSVMASEKAKRAGAKECVFVRPGGRVTECAHSNVHILKDGVFRTAPTDHLILPGIARAHLIRACHALGIPVSETPFTQDELYAADEILVSSSSNFCLYADVIDGRPVGGKDPENREKLRKYVYEEFLKATE